MAASVRSVGTTHGWNATTTQDIGTPSGFQAGDLLLVVAESQHPGSSATDWVKLVNRSQAAATGTTRLEVHAKIAVGDEGSAVTFTFPATVNHAAAQMIAIQNHGVSNVSTDIVVGTATGGAQGGASPQTNTIPGITVNADSLVLLIGSSGLDVESTTEFSNWTNANLTGITEHCDFMTSSGNGGGFGVASGVDSDGGATGDSTYDQATLYAWNAVHLGVPPAATAAKAPPIRRRRSYGLILR